MIPKKTSISRTKPAFFHVLLVFVFSIEKIMTICLVAPIFSFCLFKKLSKMAFFITLMAVFQLPLDRFFSSSDPT